MIDLWFQTNLHSCAPAPCGFNYTVKLHLFPFWCTVLNFNICISSLTTIIKIHNSSNSAQFYNHHTTVPVYTRIHLKSKGENFSTLGGAHLRKATHFEDLKGSDRISKEILLLPLSSLFKLPLNPPIYNSSLRIFLRASMSVRWAAPLLTSAVLSKLCPTVNSVLSYHLR